MDALWTTLVPLVNSALLGGLVGLEREYRKRSAGLRTHMLVSMGSAMFVLAGMSVSPASGSDLTRVIQGVASGIGFIGAGTILKLTDRLEIKGLTTASSIWLAAAVGTACGVQLYMLAWVGVVLAVLILAVLGKIEGVLESDSNHVEKERESAAPASKAFLQEDASDQAAPTKPR
jgi:putative Mg2+ transporter-C (MgtC) family protein